MQGEINDNLHNGIKINLKEDKKSAISNNKEKKEIDNYSLFIKIEDIELKLKECEEKIDALTNIHRKIYFHDVSKHYKLEFAKKYLKIDESNAYDSSVQILKYDFNKNKIEYLKNMMNKIIYHYLKGNKLAHLEYFISYELKGVKRTRQIFKRIMSSYSSFMNFDQKDFKELRKIFSDEEAMFSLLKKYQLYRFL